MVESSLTYKISIQSKIPIFKGLPMKTTRAISGSHKSCSDGKMTGLLGLSSEIVKFGQFHWIPLIEKWGKILRGDNMPCYLAFQDALLCICILRMYQDSGWLLTDP